MEDEGPGHTSHAMEDMVTSHSHFPPKNCSSVSVKHFPAIVPFDPIPNTPSSSSTENCNAVPLHPSPSVDHPLSSPSGRVSLCHSSEGASQKDLVVSEMKVMKRKTTAGQKIANFFTKRAPNLRRYRNENSMHKMRLEKHAGFHDSPISQSNSSSSPSTPLKRSSRRKSKMQRFSKRKSAAITIPAPRPYTTPVSSIDTACSKEYITSSDSEISNVSNAALDDETTFMENQFKFIVKERVTTTREEDDYVVVDVEYKDVPADEKGTDEQWLDVIKTDADK